MGWWSNARQAKAQQWFSGPVEGGGSSEQIAVAEDCYLHLFLESLYFGEVRRGLTRFYGAVMSYCSVPASSGSRMEAAVVTVPPNLRNADAKHLDRAVVETKRLFGPTPYRGGDLEAEIGLFTIPAVDLLEPYLQVVEHIALLAAAPYLVVAQPFIDPVVRAMRLLLGDGDGNAVLEIGLSKTWDRPKTGMYAVARIPSTARLVYEPRSRMLLSGGTPLAEPHLVLRLEATPQRDDWQQIPSLLEAYEDFAREARAQDLQRAQAALNAFRIRADFCPDLILPDADRISIKVEEVFNRIFKATLTSASEAPAVPEFAELGLYS